MENDGLSKINHLLAPDQLQHTHIQDIQFKRIDKKIQLFVVIILFVVTIFLHI